MSAPTFKAALLQTTSSDDVDANIEMVSEMAGRAKAAGADFILTPETVSLIEMRGREVFRKTTSEAEDRALAAFRKLAGDLNVYLLVGSLPIKLSDNRLANRSFLIDSESNVLSRYDKIHMFDVDLPGGEKYRESKNYQSGASAEVADTPWGRVGLTVCYDVRFPHLYRALGQAGADIITVPAAFARHTGRAHWEVLLRARAIETGCFILAPAQCGEHPGGVYEGRPHRKTWGHSLVIGPWGEVLEDGGEEPGILYADIDMADVAKARDQVPSLEHDRPFEAPANKRNEAAE